jgi:hypothetical protein
VAFAYKLSRDCAAVAIGNYRCQRTCRLHNVSISRTCQIKLRVTGACGVFLLDGVDDLASVWVLSTTSAIAQVSLAKMKSP